MLSGPMSESQSSEIVITDFEPVVVQAFVRYMYEDAVPNEIFKELSSELYAIARKYHVMGLCEGCMGSALNADSVLQVLDLAEMHESASLRAKCLSYIHENRMILVMSNTFVEQFDAYWMHRDDAPVSATPPVVSGSGRCKQQHPEQEKKVKRRCWWQFFRRCHCRFDQQCG